MSIINGIDLVFGGETGLVLADKTGLPKELGRTSSDEEDSELVRLGGRLWLWDRRSCRLWLHCGHRL